LYLCLLKYEKMDLSKTIKNLGILFLIVVLVLILFGMSALIFISVISSLIVPLTYIWSLVSGQSYEMACHSSDFVWKMNQWGKISLSLIVIITLIYIIV
jgi:hypothetical protein